MRTNVVELGPKGIEASLLASQVRSLVPPNPVLERSMHPLVNPVLIRSAWLDPDRDDPELDPPSRKLRQPAQRHGAAEWSAVVGDQLPRYSMLAEDSFEDGLGRLHVRRRHRFDGQHVTAAGI